MDLVELTFLAKVVTSTADINPADINPHHKLVRSHLLVMQFQYLTSFCPPKTRKRSGMPTRLDPKTHHKPAAAVHR